MEQTQQNTQAPEVLTANGHPALLVPKIRLVCDTCYWRLVKWKGRSCDDQGYGPEHDACCNWVAKRPSRKDRHIFDLRLALAQLSIPELKAFEKFVAEAIRDKTCDLDIKLGHKLAYKYKNDEVILGVCVGFTPPDKNKSLAVNMLSDEGTLITAPPSSFTIMDEEIDRGEDGDETETTSAP